MQCRVSPAGMQGMAPFNAHLTCHCKTTETGDVWVVSVALIGCFMTAPKALPY